MKPLSPSLKEKKRYIKYRVESEEPLSGETSESLVEELKRRLGLFDSAEAGLQNITYDEDKKEGIIRTTAKKLDRVKASFAVIKELDGVDVLVRSLKVSGIIKKLKD